MNKKHFFLCIAWFIIVPFLYSSEKLRYNFSIDSPLVYKFSIKGDITYQYEGISEEKFNVSSEGIVTLKTIDVKDDISIVNIIPSRTLIQVNDMLFEDLTDNETAISDVISTSVIKIKSDGRVIDRKELSSGILDVSQIFSLLPVFPEKITIPWKQTVSALNIPGVPMCSLNFTYTYREDKEGISRIRIISNQPIKEERKEKDIITSFTGRNFSNGEFIFDEGKGEIKSFDGIIDLIMNISFKVPSSPEQKTYTKQSIPLKIGVKLKIEIKRFDACQ